jgi:glutathione S-transferase
MTKPTLIYFPVRGRAELIRVVLAVAGVDYDEHPVLLGTPPQHGRPTDFPELKRSGELPFEAVPVWIEPDGFRLAQSGAIVRYLAAGHGLWGTTPRAAALCDQMLGAYEDVRDELRRLRTTAREGRAALMAELGAGFVPRWTGYLERLAARGPFLVEDALSVADLALWYLVEQLHDIGFDAALAPRERLAAHYRRIADEPRVRAWIESPRRQPFVALPR